LTNLCIVLEDPSEVPSYTRDLQLSNPGCITVLDGVTTKAWMLFSEPPIEV